ncbi:MAG: DinB family protein [Bdellovibrionales bacterium]|nr:DinB family protein [Bdellovibrionales bacterium]
MGVLVDHVRSSIELPERVVDSYLKDLASAELLIRPHPKANHMAWQLGHLLVSETKHLRAIREGSMSPLSPEFVSKHSKERCSDDTGFLTKEEYVHRILLQRGEIRDLLLTLSDDELLTPSPESIRYLGPTVACVFTGNASHWMMHVGQWAVVRRLLEKPILF